MNQSKINRALDEMEVRLTYYENEDTRTTYNDTMLVALDVMYLGPDKYHLIRVTKRTCSVVGRSGKEMWLFEISTKRIRSMADIPHAVDAKFVNLPFDKFTGEGSSRTTRMMNAIIRACRTLNSHMPNFIYEKMAEVSLSHQSAAYWRSSVANQLEWADEDLDDRGSFFDHKSNFRPASENVRFTPQEEEETMTDINTIDAQTVLALQSQHGVRTCKVRYIGMRNGDKTLYTYKTVIDVKKDERVLVQMHNSVTIAKVIEVHDVVDMSFDGELKWVLGSVENMMGYALELVKSEEALKRNIVAGRALEAAKTTMEAMGLDSTKMAELGNVPTPEEAKQLQIAAQTPAGTVA